MNNGRIYSKKVVYDNIKFDSQMECDFYIDLQKLKSCGNVRDVRVHPSYVLQGEVISGNGKRHKPITYEPDFVFYDVDLQRQRFIDVKGFSTEEFLLKWKMFDKWLNENCKGCYLEVMKYSKTTGWVEFEKYKKVMKSKRKQLIEEKNYYKKIVLQQQHQLEIEEKKQAREKERLIFLHNKDKLTSSEKKRYNELREKYIDVINLPPHNE